MATSRAFPIKISHTQLPPHKVCTLPFWESAMPNSTLGLLQHWTNYGLMPFLTATMTHRSQQK